MKQSTRTTPTRPTGIIPGYWIIEGKGTDRTILFEAHAIGAAAAAMQGIRAMFPEQDYRFTVKGPGAFGYGQFIPGYGAYRRMLPAAPEFAAPIFGGEEVR